MSKRNYGYDPRQYDLSRIPDWESFKTITNALANTSGIVCDGAKSSCAAKIASAVDAAIMAYALEDADHCFQARRRIGT